MGRTATFIRTALGSATSAALPRFLCLFLVPPVVLIPLIVWANSTNWGVGTTPIVEFPGSVIGYVSSILTTLMGAAYLNKREETKVELVYPPEPNPAPPSTPSSIPISAPTIPVSSTPVP